MSKKLGKRLETFRLEKGMTQDEVALHIGVSRSTVSRLEAGKGCGKLNRFRIGKFLDRQDTVIAAA